MKLKELNDMDKKPLCNIKGCDEDGFGLLPRGNGHYLVLCPPHYSKIRMEEEKKKADALKEKMDSLGLELDD